MKSTKYLLLVFIGMGFASFAQGQRPQPTKADSLLQEGQVEQALEAFAMQYKTDPTNKSNTYNYACALALDRQVDSAFHYLNLALANDTTVQPLSDPDFYFLIEDERWTTLQDELITRVEAKYGPYAKPELSRELWTMKLKDQAFYYHLDIADKLYGPGSPIIDALWELKHKINEVNLARMEDIITEHGWPKQSEVKGNAASTAFLIIQHSNHDVQKKYLPLLKAAADDGEVRRSNYALMADRVNLAEGKQQIYGSQIFRKEDGTYYVKDLLEPEYVNQRRLEVGLGPIEDYVKHWDIEWSIEQKEK